MSQPLDYHRHALELEIWQFIVSICCHIQQIRATYEPVSENAQVLCKPNPGLRLFHHHGALWIILVYVQQFSLQILYWIFIATLVIVCLLLRFRKVAANDRFPFHIIYTILNILSLPLNILHVTILITKLCGHVLRKEEHPQSKGQKQGKVVILKQEDTFMKDNEKAERLEKFITCAPCLMTSSVLSIWLR